MIAHYVTSCAGCGVDVAVTSPWPARHLCTGCGGVAEPFAHVTEHGDFLYIGEVQVRRFDDGGVWCARCRGRRCEHARLARAFIARRDRLAGTTTKGTKR